MAPSIFSMRSLPKHEPAPADNGTTRSFRFLDLPKEIRLMVYEELSAVTRRHDVPLQTGKHHMTLVNTTVAGVSILATCRQVNQEASYIIAPRLRDILQASPKVIVQAQYLMGLIDLHDGFRAWIQENMLDRVMRALAWRRVRAIHNYRNGKLSVEALREKLWLNTLVDERDDATFHAFLTFVLRMAAYIDSKPEVMGKYPPLTVIVVVPNHIFMQPVTTTISLARAICYKLFSPRRPFLSRTRSGTATLNWLLRYVKLRSYQAADVLENTLTSAAASHSMLPTRVGCTRRCLLVLR
jgi:hypothetical protein